MRRLFLVSFLVCPISLFASEVSEPLTTLDEMLLNLGLVGAALVVGASVSVGLKYVFKMMNDNVNL